MKRGMILAVAAFAILVAGCSKQPAVQPGSIEGLGIVDFAKVTQAHPRWKEVEALEGEIAKRRAQLELAGQSVPAVEQPSNTAVEGILDIANQEMQNHGQTLDKAIEAKMTAKQTEFEKAFNEEGRQQQEKLNLEMEQFVADIEKQYSAPLLTAQLKTKALQLTEQERQTVQKEIDQIEKEKKEKLTAKKQELEKRLQGIMETKGAAMKQQLDSYHKELTSQAEQSMQNKQRELQQRIVGVQNQPPAAPSPSTDTDDGGLNQEIAKLTKQLAMVRTEIDVAVRGQIEKVAKERKLQYIVGKPVVNINSTEITEAVISEIKKENTGILQNMQGGNWKSAQ